MRSNHSLPSNRSFGLVFASVFTLFGVWSWWSGGALFTWSFVLAMVTLAVTLTLPSVLAPFNRAWMRLGELLHPIASFIVLGAIFFLVFVPVGLVMQLSRRDALRRRFDPGAKSYWIPREPPGPDPSGLPNQF